MKKLVAIVALLAAVGVHAEEARNPDLIKQFKETHVCPSTGKMATKGKSSTYSCPGYVVDHGIPFCSGKYLGISVDQMYNLTYQKYDKENSLRKDRDENLLCDTLKKYVPIPKQDVVQ
jgi:hypothetical protein